MKILIVGSTNYERSVESAPQFAQACREIGVALASAGIELVVASSGPNTAERYVLEGAATVPGSHAVVIFRLGRGDAPELPHTSAGTDFVTSFKRPSGAWAAGQLPQMQFADAALLVGGGRGTAQVGYVAMAMGKPAVAVASFHGAAEELWPLLEPFYQRAAKLRDEVSNLREKWKPEYASLVVRMFRELIRTDAFRQRSLRSPLLVLALNLVLFTAWVWFFVKPPLIWQAAMFGLLAVSAFLGTSLRTALRTVVDPSEEKSNEVVIAELSAGLVLAFSLAMLYLAGSFTFTGKFQPFSEKPLLDDYQRVAVGITLIGIAGGWLLERVAERLTRALGDPLGGSVDK